MIWNGLLSGELEIIGTIAQEHCCSLTLQARTERTPPLDSRARAILERTLLGDRRKVIACEANVSASTVALVLKDSLTSIGLDCRPSRVPSSLVMLVHAACGAAEPHGIFIGDCDDEGRPVTIVTHVFDANVLQGLSPSQRAILCLIASGRSNLDIAARRNRSYRTVVNQIAAACLRLGVSGRLELLHRFATLPAAAAPEPQLSLSDNHHRRV
ncbi:MAG TPA: helix-turn-helix transcriptional regulator [Polyangiaceae bacterium]|nr:helix-turn-helix transcriptional regulator [Polyangiaceae bacterium]